MQPKYHFPLLGKLVFDDADDFVQVDKMIISHSRPAEFFDAAGRGADVTPPPSS